MKSGLAYAAMAVVVVLLAVATCHFTLRRPFPPRGAVSSPANRSRAPSEFTVAEYYPAPYQHQMKWRLSGTEASPLPDNSSAFDIKQFKLETFAEEGQTQVLVSGPECLYDTVARVASSADRLLVLSGDGNFRDEGDGFLWRQTNSCLIISNQARMAFQSLSALTNASPITGK